MKNLIFLVMAAAVAAGIGYADQFAGSVVVPVGRTAANDGRQMYASYCASCHGMDGKGNGPVAPALKRQPADLSVLSRNNGGRFPAERVHAVLQFGEEAAAHRTAEMPVWGPVLTRMDVSAPQPEMRALRVSNLSRYLQSLQVK
ncbi:MAG: c-type cytochrome [Terracidiphilus sp.]|jgi:mono/diheme cytochrome c family protein